MSTSAVLFVGFRVSKRPATPHRPYGYERAEDLAGLGVALVIWASAVFAGVVSIHKLRARAPHTSHLGVGVAAVVGIIGNQVVARYNTVSGHADPSRASLLADAKHSWLDALSSAGALLGLIAVALGWRWGDPVAGLAVTVFIVHVGWEVTADLFEHLMDGVDPALLAAAEHAAATIPTGTPRPRPRTVARPVSLLIEIEGFIPTGTTIDDSERIGRAVEDAVHQAVPETRAVLWCPRAMP